MSKSKHIDTICCIALAASLLITLLFMHGKALGIASSESKLGYEARLFDTARVHTIDIVCDNWDSFIETCENEEYTLCSAVIDGEAFRNIAIRAKGNTSLSSVSQMNSSRYSFKIEFDQYDSANTYYGLDKLSLNNLIQDNTYMKDYITYELMRSFGVSAPLCSFVYITVNGEDWGLYLAVEGVEQAFLERNYGSDYGELYKPDSLSMGGGRGNGREFDFSEFDFDSEISSTFSNSGVSFSDIGSVMGTPPNFTDFGESNGDFSFGGGENRPTDFDFGNMGGFGGMGSSDVKLQYIDDDPQSYSNIFESAKTDITSNDKARLISSLKQLSSLDNIEEVVDIEQVMRYFVVHNFVVNEDSYTGSMIHNYYLYEDSGKLSMIPWDYNLAFGTFRGTNAENSINDSIDYGTTDDLPMLDWIFKNEEYTAQYLALYSDFCSTLLESGYLSEKIEETAALISEYVEKDPTKFCTYDEFCVGVETMQSFCSLRAQSVSLQLSGSNETVLAEGITLSAMGSMGSAMGGGFFDNRKDENSENNQPTNEFPQGNFGDFSGGFTMPGEGFGMPGGGFGMMQGGFGNFEQTDNLPDNSAASDFQQGSNEWIILLCVICLVFMIIAVMKIPIVKPLKKR